MNAAIKKPWSFGPYSVELARECKCPAVAHPASGRQADPIWIVNPLDVENPEGGFVRRYGGLTVENIVIVFSFGAYGCTMVAVINETLNDALETAAAWLAEYRPGLIEEDGSASRRASELDAYREVTGNGDADRVPDDLDDDTRERVWAMAETDMTYTESGWIPSWEWTMTDLDPSDPLHGKIVRKAMDAYRKEYGEDPR